MDLTTVEVQWQDSIINLVDLKDLQPTNHGDFIGKQVTYTVDKSYKGRIERTSCNDDGINLELASMAVSTVRLENKKNCEPEANPGGSSMSKHSSNMRLDRHETITWGYDSDASDEVDSESCSGSGSESDEDEQPLSNLTNVRSWRTVRNENPMKRDFIEVFHGEQDVKTPLMYFRQYFDNEFLQILSTKAVEYKTGANINSTFKLPPKDLERYLGITIYMTLIKVNSVRRYWASSTRVSAIADTMPRERFEAITSSLHFGDEIYNGRTKTFNCWLTDLMKLQTSCLWKSIYLLMNKS